MHLLCWFGANGLITTSSTLASRHPSCSWSGLPPQTRWIRTLTMKVQSAAPLNSCIFSLRFPVLICMRMLMFLPVSMHKATKTPNGVPLFVAHPDSALRSNRSHWHATPSAKKHHPHASQKALSLKTNVIPMATPNTDDMIGGHRSALW